jgi:hypothetical protein
MSHAFDFVMNNGFKKNSAVAATEDENLSKMMLFHQELSETCQDLLARSDCPFQSS